MADEASHVPLYFTTLYERVRVLRRRLRSEIVNDDLQLRIVAWRQDIISAKLEHPEFEKKLELLEEFLVEAEVEAEMT